MFLTLRIYRFAFSGSCLRYLPCKNFYPQISQITQISDFVRCWMLVTNLVPQVWQAPRCGVTLVYTQGLEKGCKGGGNGQNGHFHPHKFDDEGSYIPVARIV